jgi:hypothetical protein
MSMKKRYRQAASLCEANGVLLLATSKFTKYWVVEDLHLFNQFERPSKLVFCSAAISAVMARTYCHLSQFLKQVIILPNY